MATIEMINEEIKDYREEHKALINKAYNYAKAMHHGQYRQSGEEYIVHPVSVCHILAQMHADKETLCAALLHDTIEDTKVTKEDLEREFGSEIAFLVDGVTRLSRSHFSSKEEQNNAYLRKVVTSINDDIRIIIIKLADRLHNMRTIEFKKEEKIKENSLETLDIFVPLAYYIGANRIKHELQDISFRHLDPDTYKRIEERKQKEIDAHNDEILDMLHKLNVLLSENGIPNEIKLRTKSIYGIYKKLQLGASFEDIHDLYELKVIVDKIYDCYVSLGIIHSAYRPVNRYFKDYIANPKTNLYQSLHSTVFVPDSRLVQMQIRTCDMDKVDSFGLMAYWDLNKADSIVKMQAELRNKTQFYQSLGSIDKTISDDKEFMNHIQRELFGSNIYVHTQTGEILELPLGSTPIDVAYKLGPQIACNMVGVLVNDKPVRIDTHLQNEDRVVILTDSKDKRLDEVNELIGPRQDKRLILGYTQK